MKFCEFARRLKPLISGKMNNGEFARELFQRIMAQSDDLNALIDISTNTFRKYYNGERCIENPSKLALASLDIEQFAGWIDGFGVDTCNLIAKELAPYCDAMTPENVGECCADCSSTF